MKAMPKVLTLAVLLALATAAAGQEAKPAAPQQPETKQESRQPQATQQPAAETQVPEVERGMFEFGGRYFSGDVYGRPDLPFKPSLRTSKLNEYSDIRNNFLIRRARINLDNFLGTKNYLNYQTQSSFYRNQSHLAT